MGAIIFWTGASTISKMAESNNFLQLRGERMNDKCRNVECRHSNYCQDSVNCIDVTSDTKKAIANNVARISCTNYALVSFSSLLESNGRLLEKHVHDEQMSKGYDRCFRAPY